METAREAIKGQIGTKVDELMTEERFKIVERLAPKFGLSAYVLESAKGKYPALNQATLTVPEGHVYVRVNNPDKKDLGKFWDAVQRRTKLANLRLGSRLNFLKRVGQGKSRLKPEVK